MTFEDVIRRLSHTPTFPEAALRAAMPFAEAVAERVAPLAQRAAAGRWLTSGERSLLLFGLYVVAAARVESFWSAWKELCAQSDVLHEDVFGHDLSFFAVAMSLSLGATRLDELVEFATRSDIGDSARCGLIQALCRLTCDGRFPESLLASSDKQSMTVRQDSIRTYLERDVPQLGPRIPAETLLRLWTMLAHHQGQLLNASRLAASLEVSSPTVTRYIGLLVDLLLVRRLAPLLANVGKRLVKSPKVNVRDSGLAHALLRLQTLDWVISHLIAGPSWEGFVLESLLAAAPPEVQPSFYRTAAGAELDLVLDMGGRVGLWAIEIKRTAAPSVSKGMRAAMADIAPKRSFVVYAGEDRFPLAKDVEALSLRALCVLLWQAR